MDRQAASDSTTRRPAPAEQLDLRIEWLRDTLADMPLDEIVDVQICLDICERRLHSYDPWRVADLVLGGCCHDDEFWSFRLWVIGLGRRRSKDVVADADNLADVPALVGLSGRVFVAVGHDQAYVDRSLVVAQLKSARLLDRVGAGSSPADGP